MVGGIWVFAEPPGRALSQHQLVGLLFLAPPPAASLNPCPVLRLAPSGAFPGVSASASLLTEP